MVENLAANGEQRRPVQHDVSMVCILCN